MKRQNGIAPPAAAICSRISACRRALWASASSVGVGSDIGRISADKATGYRQSGARHDAPGAPPPVALVTGGARRLGAAIVRRLHAAGYAVAVHCRASTAQARTLARELEQQRPGSCLVLEADLDRFDALPELVARTIGRFGRLDALVDNAAPFFPTPAATLA